MKSILVPIDLSEISASVVQAAVPLARAFGAQVHLLYVVRPPLVVNEFSAYTESLDARPDPEADQIMADFRARLQSQGIAAEAEQAFGGPIECIADVAGRLKAEYIVMGSHGHGALYDFLIGSTTAGVIKHARQPVFVVGAKEPRAAAAPAARAGQAAR